MTKTDTWQTRPLVREDAPNRQDSNFEKKNIWSKVPDLGSTPRHTDWLTVSRNVTLTLTLKHSWPYQETNSCSYTDWTITALLGLFLLVSWGGVRFQSTRYIGQYIARMMDDECGAVGGMSGEGNRSTRRKPVSVPLCPPQIPRDLTRSRTRAAVVRSQ
jgi:hypothetical protein